MPQFTFATAELTAEHKRSFVRDVRLHIEVQEQPSAGRAGSLEVAGELAMDMVNQENRLRLGQAVELKLTAPDGRFTQLSVLLIELKGIDAPAPKQRTYRWAFLMPVKPGHDPHGMFRQPGETQPVPPWLQQPPALRQASPRPSTTADDPQAQEISLGDLLAQLGANSAGPEMRFTSEGGLVQE